MLQHIVWTALAAEGMGASLQVRHFLDYKWVELMNSTTFNSTPTHLERSENSSASPRPGS